MVPVFISKISRKIYHNYVNMSHRPVGLGVYCLHLYLLFKK